MSNILNEAKNEKIDPRANHERGSGNLTKWAGNYVSKDSSPGRYHRQQDPISKWNNEMLGKNYYMKHSGHEPGGKTSWIRDYSPSPSPKRQPVPLSPLSLPQAMSVEAWDTNQ